MQKEITQTVLLEIEKTDEYTTRIVQWNDYPPTLEKRVILRGIRGEYNGKCKGFSEKDFMLLLEKSSEIVHVFKSFSSNK